MAITPKTRRVYKGGATPTTITTALSDDAAAISITASTGWPTVGPFYVVIDPGLSTEEKIYVGAISGTDLSSMVRGQDDTAASAHGSGAAIYPVFTATDADEANQLTATYTTKGGLVYMGDPSFTQLAIGSTAGHALKVSSTGIPEWGQIPADGIADDAVTTAKIAADAVDSSEIKNNAVVTAKIADLNVTTGKLADTAVTTGKLADSAVTSAKIADGTIVAGDLASNSVTTVKITDANVTNAKLNNGASGDIPLVTVSSSAATGGKNGDIWVVV
jgi:hypothetical protein